MDFLPQRSHKPGKKKPFFLSTNTERQILVRNNFQRANYVNLHDGSKTLKFEDIARFEGDVTRDDSQQRPLAQQSVATLLGHCFERSQHCSNIAALIFAENRRYESSRVKSP